MSSTKSLILRSVKSHLAEGRKDVVHDILVFLAEEMTRLHKEKHAALVAQALDAAGKRVRCGNDGFGFFLRLPRFHRAERCKEVSGTLH